jgi:hypothetical protein
VELSISANFRLSTELVRFYSYIQNKKRKGKKKNPPKEGIIRDLLIGIIIANPKRVMQVMRIRHIRRKEKYNTASTPIVV